MPERFIGFNNKIHGLVSRYGMLLKIGERENVRLTDITGQASSRFGWGLILCLVLVWGGVILDNFVSSNAAYAQEEPAAAPAAAPAEASGGSEAAADDLPKERSFLMWMIEASGIFGFILLLISIVMIALCVTNTMQIKRELYVPAEFIEEFQKKLEAKDYKGAYEFAKGDESLIARMMATGMSRLDRGYEVAMEGMMEVADEENMSREHSLSYIALIASTAPMVGLMGTVYGMVLSFQKIANSTVSPKPSELADGIATALFTTLEGLAIAIPAMAAYTILKNRLTRYMLDSSVASETLMGKLPVSK